MLPISNYLLYLLHLLHCFSHQSISIHEDGERHGFHLAYPTLAPISIPACHHNHLAPSSTKGLLKTGNKWWVKRLKNSMTSLTILFLIELIEQLGILVSFGLLTIIVFSGKDWRKNFIFLSVLDTMEKEISQ